MNAPLETERKQWWLCCYAELSLRRASESCELLLSTCPDNRHILFPSLSLAIHAFYSRPFKRSRGVGSLSVDLIPKENEGIHMWLTDFRDSVLVHTDATESKAAQATYHELVYSNRGRKRDYNLFEPAPPIKAYEDAANHIRMIQGKILYRIAEIHQKFEDLIPTEDGDFLFQFDKEPLFIPHAIRNEIHLHYKPSAPIAS